MARIAIAGFQHETNSFAKGLAGLPEFEMADSWPGLLTGAEVLLETHGMNLPIAGFARAALDRGHDLQPILWCAAEPSGPVTTEAFETITARILDSIDGADGVYLDLHGAMITQSHDDGEGELLARIRERYGDIPLVISLDLHANLSDAMVDHADHICIYRTYPHLDMAETGARALAPLERVLTSARPSKAHSRASYLIPLHDQCTDGGPVAELYALAETLDLELAMGFTAGDTPHTGPAWVAYGAGADGRVGQMAQAMATAEARIGSVLPDAQSAARQAMALPAGRPVILADVEDNAGGGGSSDTMGLFRALLSEGAQGALLGVIHDPEAANAAHLAGLGATLRLSLGGRSGCAGDAPYDGTFEVIALSDGEIAYEGEMYGGGTGQIGPSAALKPVGTQADVTVVISSTRNQCLDRAYFRHLGLNPEAARIIGVKSTVHFRADFAPIAQAILPLRVPGALSSDPETAPYTALRDGIRLRPGGSRKFVKKTKKID